MNAAEHRRLIEDMAIVIAALKDALAEKAGSDSMDNSYGTTIDQRR